MSLVGGYPQSYPQHHPHHPQTPHSYHPHHHHPSPHHPLQNGGMPSPSPHDVYNTYATHQMPRYPDPYHQHHPHQHDAAAATAVTGHTAATAAAAVAAGGYFPNWMLTPHTDIPTVSGHIPDGYHSFGPPASSSPGGTPYQSFIQYENGVPIRCIKRRVTANKKERRRTLSINNAFSQLRGCIPNVPSDTKLSKIKTLRLATSYISYLMDILSKDEPDNMTRTGFKADLTKKPPGTTSSSVLSSQVSGVECGLKTDSSSVISGMNIHGRNGIYDRSDDKLRKRESDGESEASSHGSSPCPEKKTKGRTGWPQHVWAAELK